MFQLINNKVIGSKNKPLKISMKKSVNRNRDKTKEFFLPELNEKIGNLGK